MTTKYLSHVYLQIFVLVTFASFSSASQSNRISFQETYETDEVKLKIRGAGLFRYMVIIKAYVGGLYLPESVSSEAVLSEVPKRLEVEYFQHIKGKDFGPTTHKLISKNVDAQTYRQLQKRIDLHASFYENVKPGDRYSLTYIPGRGTELALNGRPKGTVKGSDFAAALFSIWLGPNPMDKTFKTQLLGLK